MENPNFLKQKYNLHNTSETELSVKRTEKRSRLRSASASQAGERVPQNPEARIQNYLDRFKEIIEREDPNEREHGMRALKTVLYDKFVIKPEEIPEGYWENQRRIIRERGQAADLEQADWQTLQEQSTEAVIADQRSSLDNWVDYLSSKDAAYPDWLKYYAFRSVLNLGEYDKEKKKFTKRSKGTTKPFPDLNREALSYVLDAIEKKQAGIKTVVGPNIGTDETEVKQFEKILQGENFAKLYAWAIDKVTPATQEALAKTEGKWVKYDRNSGHIPLVQSLQGHGTGWCIAGESAAETYLKGGDMHVYYSLDEKGEPTIPRAAIRMQENKIDQIRGIAYEQNLDPYIGDVVENKLTEFPDGKAYEKKTNDMKHLTEIENKTKKSKELTKDDLIFLYEMEQPIDGFGYQRDPRIEEIRNARNKEEDMPIVFECEPNQIAKSVNEINENAKTYVGKLEPGIFDLISKYSIEHIYTSFPEGKIEIVEAELGGKSEEELLSELEKMEKSENADKIYISNYAKDMFKNKDFFTLKNKEQAKFIKLKVSDLGLSSGATTDEIYKKGEEIELELCPPETGPRLRLNYEEIFKREQLRNEYFRIAMKQITDSDGHPNVFYVNRSDDGKSWLHVNWAKPMSKWYSANEFVFRLRKLET